MTALRFRARIAPWFPIKSRGVVFVYVSVLERFAEGDLLPPSGQIDIFL
jgi:hypothetical protein